MRISYRLTPEDFARFSFHHLRSLPSAPKDFRVNRLANTLMAPVIAVAVATLLYYRLSTAVIALAGSSLLAVYIWVTYPKTHDREMYKKIQKFLDDAGPAGLAGMYWLDLTVEGLVEYSEGRTEMIAWSRVGRVGYDGGRLFIYLNSVRAVIVPLSAFRDAAEYAAFVAELRAGTRQPLEHLDLNRPPAGYR